MKTKLIADAFAALEGVFHSEWKNHATALYKQCLAEEKDHRGFMGDFARCHTADTITAPMAAKLFAVKRVAEYITKGPPSYPKGWDYLHTQKSCFYAAGIADEFGQAILAAWTEAGIDTAEVESLNYTDFVKVRQTA